MKFKTQIQQKLGPYIQILPAIFNYQIITKVILAIWLFLLGKIFQALLKSSGRVAVTSGDWKFLFTTWQGLLILVLGIVSLYVYIAFDLNAMIALCGNLLTGGKSSIEDCIKNGFDSVRRLNNLRGLLIAVYIALIAPIIGVGISISLTEGLYIPTFISSVIKGSVLYSALSGVAVLIFLSVGIANLFILHGIVLDGLPAADAGKQSRQMMKANWKDYLKQNILYILTIACLLVAVSVVFLFLPLKLISVLSLPRMIKRLLTVFFVLAGVVISILADLLSIPMYLFKMTQLYYSYKQGREFEFKVYERQKHTGIKGAAIFMIIAVIVAAALVYHQFDQIFPIESNVTIIAHRAGGIEAPENTVSGLETAWNLGAYGSEIDIQRTKDGYYVINHDGTFQRVAGDKRKPQDMTLKEVKKLSVDGEPVPTIEEMLDASRGRLVLFIELKGKTADRKMADDIVNIVKDRQMEEECVLISLKYDLIDYIETTYPELQTGFLTFASFGRTADLNCDYIGLEEESATTDAINSIHKEGKKALVWTANEKASQKFFLCTKADGLITDNVSQAVDLAEKLQNRSDLDIMVDRIKTVL